MNPGDPKAIQQGCTCPQDRNQDGAGIFNSVQSTPAQFLVQEDCPLHGKDNWRGNAPSSTQGGSA